MSPIDCGLPHDEDETSYCAGHRAGYFNGMLLGALLGLLGGAAIAMLFVQVGIAVAR